MDPQFRAMPMVLATIMAELNIISDILTENMPEEQQNILSERRFKYVEASLTYYKNLMADEGTTNLEG